VTYFWWNAQIWVTGHCREKEEVKQVEKMASSHSIGKGQTALVCQLCENDPKLKWKCLDCELPH
jgi:hypothetical protein